MSTLSHPNYSTKTLGELVIHPDPIVRRCSISVFKQLGRLSIRQEQAKQFTADFAHRVIINGI